MLPHRPRLLVVATNHPSPANPLCAPFHRYLFSELAQLCELTVVTPISWTSRLQSEVSIGNRLAPFTPPTYPLHHPLFVNIPGVGRSLNGRALARSVRNVLERTGASFDAVVATYAYPDGAAAVALADELGLPCVIKVGGTDVHSIARGTRGYHRTAAVLRAASAVIAVSRSLATSCMEMGLGPTRVHVVRNGVDGAQFRIVARDRARLCLGLSRERPIVLYAGRFEPVKGLGMLLDAFDRLGGSHAGSGAPQLVLVGYGSERAMLERRIRASPRRNDIKLRNPVSHSSLMLWLNAANVLALPSRREGSPNVVREALACGTPVVATEVGDVAEWIDSSSGEIVPVGDDAAMADALGRVLPGGHDRQAVRARVAGATWRNAALAWYRVLESAILEAAPAEVRAIA